MLRRILVGDNELVFVIRKRRFADILGPGEYWMFTLGRGIELERYNTRTQILTSAWNDNLVRQQPDLTARYFVVIETNASQVAVVYLNGRLSRVLPPSDRAIYFRGAIEVTFEVIDVHAEPEVPARLLPSLARLGRESL